MLPKGSTQTALVHKRGDTWSCVAEIPPTINLTGATAKCQIRTQSGELIDDIDAEVKDGKVLVLRRQDTNRWPLGVAMFDIQFTLPGGDVISTNTVNLSIERDVTL